MHQAGPDGKKREQYRAPRRSGKERFCDSTQDRGIAGKRNRTAPHTPKHQLTGADFPGSASSPKNTPPHTGNPTILPQN